MITSSSETKINADCLKEEFIDSFEILFQPSFSVIAIVCDNHPSNVSSFKNLLQHFNQDSDELFIWYELRKIYLLYDAVHLMKDIRNNLLNCKRLIFPSFKFNDFKDLVNVPGGEIKWKSFHDVHEKDVACSSQRRYNTQETWYGKARVTSYKLRVEGIKVHVGIQKCEFKSMSSNSRVTSSTLWVTSSNPRVTSSNLRVTSSNLRVTSSNPRVTSSNPRVTSSNPRVQESFNQWKFK